MLSEYMVSREEAIRRNVEDIKQAAKEWKYSIEDSYEDWVNEGPNPSWVMDGVKKSLGIDQTILEAIDNIHLEEIMDLAESSDEMDFHKQESMLMDLQGI